VLLGDFNGNFRFSNLNVISDLPSCNDIRLRQFVEASKLSLARSFSCSKGLFTRILNNQMSAIDYVLLSKYICMCEKRVIIDEEGLFDIHSDHISLYESFYILVIYKGKTKKVVNCPQLYWKINKETDRHMFQDCTKHKFEKITFDNKNTSDVNLA